MGQVRRTLMEFLQRKPMNYYMDRPIDGLPVLQVQQGRGEIEPRELSFFAVGDRIARVCLSGPIVGRRNTWTTVYYDDWAEMPEDVANRLTRWFEGED